MIGEFELIQRFFTEPVDDRVASGISLPNGDDASVLMPAKGHQLVVSVDTSVVDVHFPHDAPPAAIGHRALAVALSDLAAMGARSRWCLMGLTMTPHAVQVREEQGREEQGLEEQGLDEQWLAPFAQGFRDLGRRHQTALVGGDVTAGALAISVTVMGEVPSGQALTRAGARADDVVAVTGALGGGAGGLALWQRGERDIAHPLLQRYLLPEPRLAAGQALRGMASAMMDISDGLVADLGHLCAASGVGAHIHRDALPLMEGLREAVGAETAISSALSGGDDYELLVTLAASDVDEARRRLASAGVTLSVIGHCSETPGITGVGACDAVGWQHFSKGAP